MAAGGNGGPGGKSSGPRCLVGLLPEARIVGQMHLRSIFEGVKILSVVGVPRDVVKIIDFGEEART